MRWGVLLLALALVGCPPSGTGQVAGGAKFEREVKIRFDSQPLAVNASLRALGKHKAKTRKLGPAVLHFAGADVAAKVELAEALADQFAALLPPSCAHVPVPSSIPHLLLSASQLSLRNDGDGESRSREELTQGLAPPVLNPHVWNRGSGDSSLAG